MNTRNDPDSPEAQKMKLDNERAVFAAKMEAGCFKRRFIVHWEHSLRMWGAVEASSAEEAIDLARSGKTIEGTIDSDPGKDYWHTAFAEEDK